MVLQISIKLCSAGFLGELHCMSACRPAGWYIPPKWNLNTVYVQWMQMSHRVSVAIVYIKCSLRATPYRAHKPEVKLCGTSIVSITECQLDCGVQVLTGETEASLCIDKASYRCL